ncbi:MAG: glycosyltransferase family 39 protein [Candidatus Eisenbacteria bacterium]|nr:glycosyltransferase family 39 protein [Candidatus Eisenbacteria bacterium]
MSAPARPRGTGFPLAPLAAVAALGGAVVAARFTAAPYANLDSHAFESLARALLDGRGFVYREPMLGTLDLYAFRSPVYAAFLALGLRLGGIPAALALQGAIAGVAAALVGAIGARLAGRRAGLIAFALALLWPASWVFAGQILSETLYAVLAVTAVWLGLEAAERRSAARAVLCGLACALALLARPPGVALLLALVGWLSWRYRRGAVVCGLVALVAWAPWPVRNARHLHAFVPLLTSGGINAWAGNGEAPVSEGWVLMSRHTGLGEVGLDRMFWRLALAEARREPARVARRMAAKAVAYLVPREPGRIRWFHGAALLFALGALLVPAARARLTLPALVWLAHAAVTVPLVVGDRYRLPTEWVVALAAGLGIDALLALRGARRAAAAPNG